MILNTTRRSRLNVGALRMSQKMLKARQLVAARALGTSPAVTGTEGSAVKQQ